MNILNPRVDAPRELSKLMEMDRTALYILGMHLGIFKGTADEQAFVTRPADQQCQRVRDELLFRDANGWPDEGQLMPTTPVMPEQEPQPEQPAESNEMQPPQFPRPVIPSTVGQQPTQAPQGMPQMPQQSMQMPMQMQPAFPPQMQQPQAPQGMPPQMPMGFPQMAPQTAPQAPQFPQGGMPQMQAPTWQMPTAQPQAAPPQQPVLPSGRAPAAPSGPQASGLGEVLTKIAAVQEANQKLLDAIHKQGALNTALLQRVLGVQITVAQMQGCPMEALVTSVAQFGNDESVKAFLQAISGGGGPTSGKA